MNDTAGMNDAACFMPPHGTTLTSTSKGVETPVSFNGDGKEFIRLCARGALLQLVTFGFYRFWLVTDIRNLLWSGVSAQGDPLEYTGKAKELLIGFFIALAIYIPIGLLYFLVTVEASAYHGLAGLPFFLFYILFGQFILYRARMYRLSRTVWRSVRFWVSGSRAAHIHG